MIFVWLSDIMGLVVFLIGGDWMSFSYNRLWKLLIDKGMAKKDLKEITGLTSTTIAKLGKGQTVNMEVLGRICKALQVNVGDIVDYVPDEK